ncbi:hypothetical protein [Kitasatospora sp. A2-31]|uniref:hypothetical protein n=1 Tax=Kitasatospora sp. A2-31 TaxID=2916414 RepID=UPI001EE9F56F|nr:hypothetical protein [Kitasatospora sp. A2-31]MCG6494266.1 hypothetical protein [Kitasatospora sp. A2-31]
MRERGKDLPAADTRPRRVVKPLDEAAGDRSYGDRAAGAEPDPASSRNRPPDGTAVRESYDATAEAARAVPGREDGSEAPDTEE